MDVVAYQFKTENDGTSTNPLYTFWTLDDIFICFILSNVIALD